MEGHIKKHKLDYLLSLQYPVLLEKRNDRFFLVITELSLIAEGKNLESAYEELCARKKKLFEDALESGIEDTVNLPDKIQRRNQVFYQLKIFLVKSLIVCLLAVSLSTLIAVEIRDKLFKSNNVSNIMNEALIATERFAVLSKPDKEEKIGRLRNALGELRPFIHEFQAVLKEEPGIKH